MTNEGFLFCLFLLLFFFFFFFFLFFLSLLLLLERESILVSAFFLLSFLLSLPCHEVTKQGKEEDRHATANHNHHLQGILADSRCLGNDRLGGGWC